MSQQSGAMMADINSNKHTEPAPFVGLVLAGGRSTRMGQDKSSLLLNGQTLLQRAVDLLTAVGACEVLVSTNAEQQFTLNNATLITDYYANKGPLGGIHAALTHSKLPLLIVPVDMPFLRPELLTLLLQAGTQNQCVACFQQHILPLYLPNQDTLREHLTGVLTSQSTDKKSLSIKRLIQQANRQELVLLSGAADDLANINDPEQWQNALRYNEQLT